MSQDGSKPGKSRRRFLADLLFLGGGVTAASLLAKSTLFQEPSGSPEHVVTPEPKVSPEPVVPNHPMPGEVAVPEGDYVEPRLEEYQEVIPGPQSQKEGCPPQVRGRMKVPEPNPAGAPPPPPPSQR